METKNVCCDRCQRANPNNPCNCKCGGVYHGIRYGNPLIKDVSHFSRTLNEHLGGEVLAFIKNVNKANFNCTCGKSFIISHYLGYPHEGGLADQQGRKWWVYVTCPHCQYDWSYWKIENRLKYQQVKLY